MKVSFVYFLALVCCKLAKARVISEICDLGSHDSPWIEKIFNVTIEYLSDRFEQLLHWNYIRLTSKILVEFSRVIEKRSRRKSIFGFIDGTIQNICRPSSHRLDQSLAYSERIKADGFNYQEVATPDGLIVHLFGLFSAQINDVKLYLTSNIADVLRKVAQSLDRIRCKIYGDKGYSNITSDVLEAPVKKPRSEILSQEQMSLNNSLRIERLIIEWV